MIDNILNRWQLWSLKMNEFTLACLVLLMVRMRITESGCRVQTNKSLSVNFVHRIKKTKLNHTPQIALDSDSIPASHSG